MKKRSLWRWYICRIFRNKKVKVKANIIRGCLTQGSLVMAAPLRGGLDQKKTCSRYIRDLLKDTSLKFWKNVKESNFGWKRQSLQIFRHGNIYFKNFHSLFDGPTCLNKHYRSIHGAAILRGRPFYDFLQKINKGLIFLCLHFLIHSLAFCSTR